MKTECKYGRYDRSVWYVSILVIAAYLTVSVWLVTDNRGNDYFAAWFIFCAAIIMALMVLSAPKAIFVTDDSIELRSLVKSTYIPIESVVEVKTIRRREVRSLVPLWGIFGFWGYYGRYIDLHDAKLYTLYATSRVNLVSITTRQRRYVISCRQPNKLVETIAAQKSPKRG